MKITEIKRGEWYETTHGIGPAVSVGGTRPPSVMVQILGPIPRGLVNLKPRDVLAKIPKPEGGPND